MFKQGLIGVAGFFLILLIQVSGHAAPRIEIEGKISHIDRKTLTIKGKTYPLLNGGSTDFKALPSAATQCWVNGARLTCGTLAAVGYVDEARVTLENGVVSKVEIIQMSQ